MNDLGTIIPRNLCVILWQPGATAGRNYEWTNGPYITINLLIEEESHEDVLPLILKYYYTFREMATFVTIGQGYSAWLDLNTGLQTDGISPGLRALSKPLPKPKVMFLACSCIHSARDDGCITPQILYGWAYRSCVFRHDQVTHSYVTNWAQMSPAWSHGRSDYRII
jgi:hypothetical protein